MQLRLDRYMSNEKSTLGRLYLNNELFCYVAEDAFHMPKIKGKTRIPAGSYRLHLKPLGSSHFDTNYTNKFGNVFHKGMIELENVPNYVGVLIHIGNDADDTEGCLLVGLSPIEKADEHGSYRVASSTDAYKKLYPLVRDALHRHETVTIRVVDLDRH